MNIPSQRSHDAAAKANTDQTQTLQGRASAAASLSVPDSSPPDGADRIGRRRALAVLGFAGVAALAGGTLNATRIHADDPLSADDVVFQQEGGIVRTVGGKLAEWVSVADFGAVGDGVTDDTAAIQLAFQQVPSGGAVFFPSGIYLVTPASASAYVLSISNKSVFSILGQGVSSVIRVKAGSGNYRGIIGLHQTTVALDQFSASGLVFDHNRQNNVLASTSAYTASLRSSISNYGSTASYGHISVSDCTIRNADGVVSLYFPKGVNDGKLVKIENCTWLSAGNANGSDFDQSFINATCDQLHVTGCSFEGASWAFAPRTAIETHASNCVLTGNTIARFQIGANLTGISQSGTTVNQVCSGNTFHVSRDGVLIWSQSLAPANASVGFQNLIVTGNTIELDPYQYNFSTVVGGCRGISIYGGALSVAYEQLAISGNVIRYPREVGTPYISKFALKSFGAIGSYENGNQTNLASHVSISGNQIVNCPASGIFFDLGRVRGLTIDGNELIDCGTTLSPAAQFSNRVPLYLATALESDCVIQHNVITQTDAAPTITDFLHIRDRGTGGYTFHCRNNTFSLSSGADLTAITDYVGVFNSAQKLMFEGIVPTQAIRLPVIAGGIGARVVFADSGVVALKTQASDQWKKEAYGSAAPTSGDWNAGDIVYHTAPAASGHIGWICVETGAPGVWKTFGVIEA